MHTAFQATGTGNVTVSTGKVKDLGREVRELKKVGGGERPATLDFSLGGLGVDFLSLSPRVGPVRSAVRKRRNSLTGFTEQLRPYR